MIEFSFFVGTPGVFGPGPGLKVQRGPAVQLTVLFLGAVTIVEEQFGLDEGLDLPAKTGSQSVVNIGNVDVFEFFVNIPEIDEKRMCDGWFFPV